MKRRKIAIAATALLLAASMTAALSSCGGNARTEREGESTTLVTDKSPDRLSAEDVAYAFIQKQSEREGYTIESENVITVQSLVNLTQTVRDTTVKREGEYLQETVSDTFLVRATRQTYLSGEKVAYRYGIAKEPYSATREEYKAVYGVAPDDLALDGFLCNGETIRFAEKAATSGDTLTYRFVLDGEKAGGNVKKQLFQLCNLKSEPAFSSVQITLTVKKDWTPVKTVTSAEYTADVPLLGTTKCLMKKTSTYSVADGETDFTAFRAAAEKPTQAVVPLFEDDTPVMEAASAFASLDYAQGVRFDAEFGAGLFEANGLMQGPITAALCVKYNADVAGTGNLYGLLDFRLDADFSNVSNLLTMIAAFAPADLSFLSSTASLSLYYTGEGALCLVLYENGSDNPNYVGSIDLLSLLIPSVGGNVPELTSKPDLTALCERAEERFLISATETGQKLTLREEFVSELASSYQALIDRAAQSGGDTVRTFLGAQITGAELEFSYAEGKLSRITADVRGVPESSGVARSLFRFSLSVSALGGELKGDKDKVEGFLADKAAADGVSGEIVRLEEEMWLGEGYAEAVDEVFTRYAALTQAQKALVPNYERAQSLKALHDERKAEADSFLSLLPDDWNGADDAVWEALNALYEGGIKDCSAQRTYIGERVIQEYLAAREEYERARAEELSQTIARLAAQEAQTSAERKELLETFRAEVRAPYLALSVEGKALVAGYAALEYRVYATMLEDLTARFQAISEQIGAVNAAGSATQEEAFSVYRAYREGCAIYTFRTECPESLAEEKVRAESAYSAVRNLLTFDDAFTKITAPVLKAYSQEKGMPQTETEAGEADFSALSADELNTLLEETEEFLFILEQAADTFHLTVEELTAPTRAYFGAIKSELAARESQNQA